MLTDWPVPFPQTAHCSCPSGRFELRFGPVTLPGPQPQVSPALLARPPRASELSVSIQCRFQPRRVVLPGERVGNYRLTPASFLIKATPFLWVF